jgi:hypothetical protein
MNRYASISKFGAQSANNSLTVENPLTYCLDTELGQRFIHGGQASRLGPGSTSCQMFMSEYCANNWDGFCDLAMQKDYATYNPEINKICIGDECLSLTPAETLLYNTASKKYLVRMLGGKRKYAPFDPTVPSSPMISYWENDHYNVGDLIPVYAVDPKTIDDDIVMNKILTKPIIAINILINIYNTMKRRGDLKDLKGTKLGDYFTNSSMFAIRGGLN